MTTDSVCGMSVDERTSAHALTYCGKTYAFCSEACREEFRRHPEEYVSARTKDASQDV